MSDAAIAELAPKIGVRNACDVVGVAQASYYRRHAPQPVTAAAGAASRTRTGRSPARCRSSERSAILSELHSERFVDMAPTEVWATLLDDGRYLGSISTFYRCCYVRAASRERRRHADPRAAAVKPELVALASRYGVVVGYHEAARRRPSGAGTTCM